MLKTDKTGNTAADGRLHCNLQTATLAAAASMSSEVLIAKKYRNRQKRQKRMLTESVSVCIASQICRSCVDMERRHCTAWTSSSVLRTSRLKTCIYYKIAIDV